MPQPTSSAAPACDAPPGGSRFRYLSPWLLVGTALWGLAFAAFFPDPGALAARNWPLVLVGLVGAFIGNMTAIGGGIVYIPVLMFVYHVDPVGALKLAFVSQAVGMTSGASGWLQRREVPLELLRWTVPGLILGTIVSTFVLHPQPFMVKGLFGPISFLVGLLTLLLLKREGSRDSVPVAGLLPLALLSVVGGVVTGWVAIGEGEIIAAFCMLAYGLKASRAIGLGVVLLAINSILLALLHALYFGGVPWDMAIFTMLGVLWGGRLGPFVAQWIPAIHVKRIFGWLAVLDGLAISYQVFRTLPG
jgi:uncharacterized membrane protein YfcA